MYGGKQFMPKNRFQKAMLDGYTDEGTFNNINESIRLAKELKVYDVVNASGKSMGILAEIVARLKVSEELEIMEIEPIERIEA